MREPIADRMYESFLRVGTASPGQLISKDAPSEDPETFLRIIRDRVAYPALHAYINGTIDWFCFLLHDRTGGVPVPEHDDGAFIHMRFSMCSPNWKPFPVGGWELTRKMDPAQCKDGLAWRMLGEQSSLICRALLEFPEYQLAPHMGQFLHHFSNMIQMKVA